MLAVNKQGFILVVAVVFLVAGMLWATLTWVSADGALQVWTGDTGFLRVLARGVAVVPRWSGERSGAQAIVTEVRATTSDGWNTTNSWTQPTTVRFGVRLSF